MKKWWIAAACLIAISARAQVQVGYTSGNTGIGAKTVPASTTLLKAGIVYVASVHLTDPSGTATTVSLYDGATPIYSWPMGGTYPTTLDLNWKAIPVSFANGLSWSSSTANTALGEVQW